MALDAKPPEFTLPNPVRPAFDTTGHDDHVIVNIGPSHPATHGTVQIIAELDGERVVRTDVHCGYLHRGFEKECESHTWHNLIPYVDRLNYVSALINDFAYCEAVETLADIADHAALPPPAHAAVRILAHRRPSDLRRRRAHGTGRDDGVPVPGHGPRLHVRAHRRSDRRARDLHLRPHRRPGARPAGRLARQARGHPRQVRDVHRPRPRPDGPQPHLHRPHAQRRRDLHRRRGQLGLHRRHPALDRRAARPAPRYAVPRLRRPGLRSAGRHQRRQLRPLLRPHARDGRVGAHDPAAGRHAPRRARSTSTTTASRFPTRRSSTRKSNR